MLKKNKYWWIYPQIFIGIALKSQHQPGSS